MSYENETHYPVENLILRSTNYNSKEEYDWFKF